MKFLERIFGRKNIEPEIKEIRLNKLEEWLKSNFSNYEEIDRYIADIKKEIGETRTNMAILEKVKFDPDTDPRIKTRVIDNINAYSKQVNSFLTRIESSLLGADNSLNDFYTVFYVEVDRLNKGASKNVYIAQSLFRNEIGKIGGSLKALGSRVNMLKKVMNSETSLMVLNISELLKKLKSSIKTKENLNNQINSFNENCKTLEDENSSLNEHISELIKSDSYKTFRILEDRKIILGDEITAIKNKVFEIFSPIERGLKKLQHEHNSKILDTYITAPLALFEDEKFEILEILQNLRGLIVSKKIDFFEKNSKILDHISSIKKDSLVKLVNGYKDRILKIKEVDKELVDNTSIKLHIEYVYKINFNNHKIERINSELEKINSKLNSIQIEETKNSIEKEIFKISGDKVNVII